MLGEVRAYLGSPQSQKVTLVTRVDDLSCIRIINTNVKPGRFINGGLTSCQVTTKADFASSRPTEWAFFLAQN